MNLNENWLAQCRAVCGRVKYVAEEMHWASRTNHAGAVSAQSAVLDSNFVAIRGLYFLGEAQKRRYGTYQKYSLMFRDGGTVLRVLALEVMPHHVCSHQDEDVRLFGPHLHMGDVRANGLEQLVREVRCNLDVSYFDGWIERFRRHALLNDHGDYKLSPPFPDDLFGLA